MKKIIIVCCISAALILSCNNSSIKKLNNQNTTQNTHFIVTGTLKNFSSNKVYLNKIFENTISPIDSSDIINNTFIFKGKVKYPERFVLTFRNYSSSVILILENKKIQIFIDQLQIENPIITGSPLNSKLDAYLFTSKKIFKKINYLFPKFQKARLENDIKKLNEIGIQMKKIEAEFTDFSYHFIKNNNDSYLSAMLLRDQLKMSNIDTIKVKNSYKMLSTEVKKSPDGEIIASFLNLH